MYRNARPALSTASQNDVDEQEMLWSVPAPSIVAGVPHVDPLNLIAENASTAMQNDGVGQDTDVMLRVPSIVVGEPHEVDDDVARSPMPSY